MDSSPQQGRRAGSPRRIEFELNCKIDNHMTCCHMPSWHQKTYAEKCGYSPSTGKVHETESTKSSLRVFFFPFLLLLLGRDALASLVALSFGAPRPMP